MKIKDLIGMPALFFETANACFELMKACIDEATSRSGIKSPNGFIERQVKLQSTMTHVILCFEELNEAGYHYDENLLEDMRQQWYSEVSHE